MQELQEWVRENWVKDGAKYNPDIEKLFARQAGWEQVMFVRDILARMLDVKAHIFSTHCSKSLELPVYAIHVTIDDRTFRIYARNNFYGWVVSVDSDMLLDRDIFSTMPRYEDYLNPDPHDYRDGKFLACYAEGFPEAQCFGSFISHDDDPLVANGTCMRWTMRVATKYELFMLAAFLRAEYRSLSKIKSISDNNDIAI